MIRASIKSNTQKLWVCKYTTISTISTLMVQHDEIAGLYIDGKDKLISLVVAIAGIL